MAQLCAWILCQVKPAQQPCGECQSCQWLKAGTHPNVYLVSPHIDAKGKLSNHIKIEQVRALIPFVQQTSDGVRIIVIQSAEKLNVAAANALLKTLEEPQSNTLILLVSDQALQLMPTIRSRVQEYPLGHIQIYDGLNHVMTHANCTPQEAQVLLNLAANAPLLACQLIQHPAFKARKQWLEDWHALIKQKISPIVLSQEWQKRLNLGEFLTLLQWMLRDIIALKLNQVPLQTDLNFINISQDFTLAKLFQIQHSLMQHIHNQQQNVQSGLMFDAIIMGLITD